MIRMRKVIVRDRSFYKELLIIAAPIILQNIITIGVNMMDTIMLGSFGEVQLSGSSLANDFINIFQILCMGMGNGAAVLTAQFYGAGNQDGLKKTAVIMLKFALITGSLFTVADLFFPSGILSIYTKDPEVIAAGAVYLRWSLPTFLLTAFSLTLTQVLRSVKTVKIPLYASIISFFFNIFFNWVFIFGNLGAPRMEIAGAAVGTVIARVAEFVIIVGYFFFQDKKIHFQISDLSRIDTGDVNRLFFHFSIPVMLSDSLLGFGNSAVSVVVGHMGAGFTAAYAIIGVIQRFTTVFTSGIGAAAHTLTGNRVGEGRKQQAYDEAITMLIISIVLGISGGIFIRLAGPLFLKLYNITADTMTTAMEMLDAVAIMIVFQAMQSVITKGILRGGGDTKFAMLIDAVFMWIISVPLGWYAGIVAGADAFTVFICLKIDWAIKSVIGSIRIVSGRWIHTINSAAAEG